MMHYKFKLFVVLLVLTALSLGAGGELNLCLAPDGNTHITQGDSSCEFSRECSPAGFGERVRKINSVRSQAPCLDIELWGDFSGPPNGNIVQIPPPTLAPIGLPTIPVPSNNKPLQVIPLNTLPQIALQQSVVLLI